MSGDWQPLAFGLSAAGTVGMQLFFFAIAFTFKFDKVTDLAGCLNFIAVALLTLLFHPSEITLRQVVATGLVCASRFQLGSYLLYRVLSRGRDSRFDQIRDNCATFFGFWVFQMIWVFGVSLSLIYINATPRPDQPLCACDLVGWAVFVGGFALQVTADVQKSRFRSDTANAKKVCNIGVWKYSRHPNFCGEVLMWWGIFIAGCAVFASSPTGYATIIAPLLTMAILLGLSGVPTSEGQMAKRWYDGGEAQRLYEEYFVSTPPLWLCPPGLYRRMPLALKRVLCFELPMYEYREHAAPSAFQASGDDS